MLRVNTSLPTTSLTGLLSIGLVLVVLVSGCGSSSSSGSTSESEGKDTTESVKPIVRVVVILDQSGSAPNNRIPQMHPEQFRPFFDVLENRGGEIAIGTIQSDSNRPLNRLQADPPPMPPPSLPDNLNPYEEVQRRAEIEQKMGEYRRKLGAREQNVQQKIQAFQDELKQVLNRKADAKYSDIRQAVIRAELFLREPTVSDQPVQRFAILVTDGLDNVTKKLPAVESGATYLVVNGSGVLGILKKLNPKTFESPRAAFNYVARRLSKTSSSP